MISSVRRIVLNQNSCRVVSAAIIRPFASYIPSFRDNILSLNEKSVHSRPVLNVASDSLRSYLLFSTRSLSAGRRSPYEILNVPRTASNKEIKLAYYHLAKIYHPDLHREKSMKEQVEMKKKFQEVSAAYEILTTNPSAADWNSHSGQASSGSGASGDHAYTTQQQYQGNAEDIFNSVLQDSEVLKDVVGMLLADTQAEFKMAIESASHGDFDYLWEIVKANKGVIFGVVAPTALILRFPAVLSLVLRGAIMAGNSLFIFLLQSGRTKELSLLIWQQIIRNSEMHMNYLRLKEEKRQKKMEEYKLKGSEQHSHQHSQQIPKEQKDHDDSKNDSKRTGQFRWKSRK